MNDESDLRDFRLPDLGEGLTEGEIAAWLVAVGDEVDVDQPVAEIETAKAVVEVSSPYAGVVVGRHGDAGEQVEVGQPLLSIRTAAREDAGGDSTDGASGNVLVGYGTSGSRGRRRRHAEGAPPATAPGRRAPVDPGDAGPARPLAKPPVRKLAKDLGVDLQDVTPTGAGGTVTRDDVRAASRSAATAPERGRTEATRVPLSAVRREIARRVARSRREIPEATAWVDCDATALLDLRAQLAQRCPDVPVSPLAIVLRLCVLALRRVPELNATLDADADELILHDRIHLGIAAQTPRGLLVPVLRDAQDRSVPELAAELHRLAEGAREGSLAPTELQGSTFSVSNYGSFGVDGGNPVINHPEAAILGVGRISRRPWVHEGQLAARHVVQLTVAFDHRVCDGAEAAGFLRHVADGVEHPAVVLAGG